MNKKEIRYAFKTVLEAVENIKCADLHHPKKHQHESGYVCPAEYHLNRQLFIVREILKEHGIYK